MAESSMRNNGCLTALDPKNKTEREGHQEDEARHCSLLSVYNPTIGAATVLHHVRSTIP